MTNPHNKTIYKLLRIIPKRIDNINTGLSLRKYSRIYLSDKTYVLSTTPASEREEFINYLTIYKILDKYKIPVPKIISQDKRKLLIIQEDAGNTTLEKFVKHNKNSHCIAEVYKKILDLLIDIQKINTKPTVPLLSNRSFSYKRIMREYTNLIEPYLIKKHLRIRESDYLKKLKGEYSTMAKIISKEKKVFCHRDFQSSNILLDKKSKNPKVIDFQGARFAPRYYDLVSLLECNYAILEKKIKEKLKRYYFEKTKLNSSFKQFQKLYKLTLIQRKLHDAAIFAKLYLDHKRKKHLSLLKNCIHTLKEEKNNISNLLDI